MNKKYYSLKTCYAYVLPVLLTWSKMLMCVCLNTYFEIKLWYLLDLSYKSEINQSWEMWILQNVFRID